MIKSHLSIDDIQRILFELIEGVASRISDIDGILVLPNNHSN